MAVCSSTKIDSANPPVVLDENGFKVCTPFTPTYTAKVDTLKFWLKKHPTATTGLPAQVQVWVELVSQTGVPAGAVSGSVTKTISGSLDTTGELFTAEFSSQFTLTVGVNYGIVFFFDHEASDYSIIIAGGEDDTCPFETGGDSIPHVSARYPNYVWTVSEWASVPAYYQFIAVTGDLQVATLACSGAGNTSFTAGGEILAVPDNRVVATRGFEWGTDIGYGEEWSEEGNWGVGTFYHTITGLTPGTTYHYRAKACASEVAETTIFQGILWTCRCHYEHDPAYATVWGALTGGSQPHAVGQRYDSGNGHYYIYRAFAAWDTSSIPSNATITAAFVKSRFYEDHSTTNFNIQIQNGQPTWPKIPADPQNDVWDANNYNKANYSGDGGSVDAGTLEGGYAVVNLNATGLDWIYKGAGAETKLCFRSDREIAGTVPTGDEYVQWKTLHYSGGKDPELHVSYVIS